MGAWWGSHCSGFTAGRTNRSRTECEADAANSWVDPLQRMCVNLKYYSLNKDLASTTCCTLYQLAPGNGRHQATKQLHTYTKRPHDIGYSSVTYVKSELKGIGRASETNKSMFEPTRGSKLTHTQTHTNTDTGVRIYIYTHTIIHRICA